MNQKYLWSFYWDCGRSGSLEGLFVATEKEIEEATGQEVYFGEVLGKHSEVYGTIDEGDISKVEISPEAVEEVSKHLGETWSGWNPLEYVRYECEKCGDGIAYEEMSYSNDEYDRICSYCHDHEGDGDDE